MHAALHRASGRTRLWTFWALFTVASLGLAFLLAGVYIEGYRLAGAGASLLGFGALIFLALEFWYLGTHPEVLSRSRFAAVPSADRAVEFLFPEPTPIPAPNGASPTAERGPIPQPWVTLTRDEPLVEFELVTEPIAPTELQLPPAFQAYRRTDPEGAWRARDPPVARISDPEPFLPATERRESILEGLPLISSILSGQPPEAQRVVGPPPGKTRGQCSSCGTYLWAPTQRPIRLRCPRCGHVKTLTD